MQLSMPCGEIKQLLSCHAPRGLISGNMACALEKSPQVSPVNGFIMQSAPQSIWMAIPVKPSGFSTGAFAKAATTAAIASGFGLWVCPNVQYESVDWRHLG